MNYIKITRFDVANGPGIRDVLWLAGCNHHCDECHNPQTWAPNVGERFTEEVFQSILQDLKHPHRAGLTLSGGDPLHPNNRQEVTHLVRRVKYAVPYASIWMYTGYLWEQIRDYEAIRYVDVVVDGPYLKEQRNITLRYCGSENQRVIDVHKTFENDRVTLWDQ